jgi:hypothetical protein
VISIAVACFILWWRRKRAGEGKKASPPTELPGDKAGVNAELDTGASPDPDKKQELDAGNEINEIGPGVHGAPAELPAEDLTTGTPRAELPGN